MIRYASRYPATIGIIKSDGNGGEFCTKFASMFIVFRRKMYENLEDKYEGNN